MVPVPSPPCIHPQLSCPLSHCPPHLVKLQPWWQLTFPQTSCWHLDDLSGWRKTHYNLPGVPQCCQMTPLNILSPFILVSFSTFWHHYPLLTVSYYFPFLWHWSNRNIQERTASSSHLQIFQLPSFALGYPTSGPLMTEELLRPCLPEVPSPPSYLTAPLPPLIALQSRCLPCSSNTPDTLLSLSLCICCPFCATPSLHSSLTSNVTCSEGPFLTTLPKIIPLMLPIHSFCFIFLHCTYFYLILH